MRAASLALLLVLAGCHAPWHREQPVEISCDVEGDGVADC